MSTATFVPNTSATLGGGSWIVKNSPYVPASSIFGPFATVNGSYSQVAISGGGPSGTNKSFFAIQGYLGATATFTGITGHTFALVISRHPAGGAFTIAVDGTVVWEDTCYGGVDYGGVDYTEVSLNRILVPIPMTFTDTAHTIVVTSLAVTEAQTAIYIDGLITITGTVVAPNPNVYVALGDSITYGVGSGGALADPTTPSLTALDTGGWVWYPLYGRTMDSSYPGVVSRLLSQATKSHVTVNNLGVSGDQLACLYGTDAVGGMWMAFRYALALNPRYLTIMFGTNDASSTTVRDYAIHMAALIQFLTLALPQTIIAIGTPPMQPAATSRQEQLITTTALPGTLLGAGGTTASGGTTAAYGTIHTALKSQAQALRSVVAIMSAQNPNVRIAYTHEALDNDAAYFQEPQAITWDGIHPNALGHTMIGIEFARALTNP